jgi:hypothetical protein
MLSKQGLVALGSAVLLAGGSSACGTAPEARTGKEVGAEARPANSTSRNNRAERPGFTQVPLCEDARNEKLRQGAAIREGSYTHDATRSSFSRAKRIFEDVAVPSEGPEWLQCIAIDLFWESTDAQGKAQAALGSITVNGFDAKRSDEATKHVIFQMFIPQPPTVPPPDGEWRPIEGREGWYEEMSSTRHDSGQRTGGTRIGWTLDDSSYFELLGPFALEQALRIADSVKPLP